MTFTDGLPLPEPLQTVRTSSNVPHRCHFSKCALVGVTSASSPSRRHASLTFAGPARTARALLRVWPVRDDRFSRHLGGASCWCLKTRWFRVQYCLPASARRGAALRQLQHHPSQPAGPSSPVYGLPVPLICRSAAAVSDELRPCQIFLVSKHYVLTLFQLHRLTVRIRASGILFSLGQFLAFRCCWLVGG